MAGVIEKSVTITSKPDEFFDKLNMKTFIGPVVVPLKIKTINVLEPDGVAVNSVMRWCYVLKTDEAVKNAKEKILRIDDSKKSYLSSFFEGDIGSQYNRFYVTWSVIEETTENSVKCIIAFTKKTAEVRDPTDYLDLFGDLITGLDKQTNSMAMKGVNMQNMATASLNEPHQLGFAQVVT